MNGGTNEHVGTDTTGAGIVSLWSVEASTAEFVSALADAASRGRFALAMVWFSRSRHDGAALARGIRAAVPALCVVGCSTAGEITPDGLQDGGVLAVLLPASRFDTFAFLLPDIDRLGMDEIVERTVAARRRIGVDAMGTFALAFVDGTTCAEEAVTAALQRGLDEVELVGGSAGDALPFGVTQQLYDGEVHERAAVLVLVRTTLPFRSFTDNNFRPTDVRFVITRADVDRRIVHEFDAEPAADAYAAALGMEREALTISTFASHPLVLRIGGAYYCRAVRELHEDGSLSLFCAIDTGLVLTLAKSEGMVRASREHLDALEAVIGPPDFIIGFDCVHRRLDAAVRGATARMESLLRERRVVGFFGYGEQYGSMYLSQTMTGIAFGTPPE